MLDNKTPPEEHFRRVRRLLPPLVNLDLLVLKGHLLMEEQLQLFLKELSRSPKFLRDARLSFNQKMHLFQAVSGCDAEWLTFITHLNTLRNSLAHRLEPGDVAALVDDVLRHYWQKGFRTPTSIRRRASLLRQTLVLVIGTLSGFVEGFTASRTT